MPDITLTDTDEETLEAIKELAKAQRREERKRASGYGEDPAEFGRRAAKEAFAEHMPGDGQSAKTRDEEPSEDTTSTDPRDRLFDQLLDKTDDEIIDFFSQKRRYIIDGFRGIWRWHFSAFSEAVAADMELAKLNEEWKKALDTLPAPSQSIDDAQQKLEELDSRRSAAINDLIILVNRMESERCNDMHDPEGARNVWRRSGKIRGALAWRSVEAVIDWRKRAEAAAARAGGKTKTKPKPKPE